MARRRRIYDALRLPQLRIGKLNRSPSKLGGADWMPTYAALLRGINVGRAKRVRMEDLREAVSKLGYTNVRTLINSGNVVFEATRRLPIKAAASLEDAIASRTGVSARVTLLSANELAGVVDECPLLDIADDPARLLVAVPASAGELARLQGLMNRNWTPEMLALGSRAAYLWCPEGVGVSTLGEAVGRELGDALTTRNWTTMKKLVGMVG